MGLKGFARSWLMNLPSGSIDSWEDLYHQFVANFQGTFERPGMESDLHAVVQCKVKSLKQFIQCFSQV